MESNCRCITIRIKYQICGVVDILELPSLTSLNLSGTGIASSKKEKHILGLGVLKLKHLDVSNTLFSDVEASLLENMNSLVTLSLSLTNTTDETTKYLENKTQLKR